MSQDKINFQAFKSEEQKKVSEEVVEKSLQDGIKQEDAEMKNFEVNGEAANDMNDEEFEEEVLPYIRVDCEEGYIYDEDEIRTFRVSQTRDVALNYLLGDYDEQGNYIISQDILHSLVNLNKRIDNGFGEVIFLESIYKFEQKGALRFSLSFVSAENNQQTAVLRVLEQIKKLNGYVINTHSYVVATYTDVNDENFLSKVYKVFHILKDEGEGKDDPELVKAIIMRIRLVQVYQEFMLEGLQEIEKQYFLSRIELLKDPKYEKILNEFARLRAKAGQFYDENHALYYLFQNQLLDMALENMQYMDNELYLVAFEDLRPAMQSYATICEQKHIQDLEKTAQKLNLEQTPKLGASAKKVKKGKAKGKSQGKKGGKSKKKGGKDKSGGGKAPDAKSKNSQSLGRGGITSAYGTVASSKHRVASPQNVFFKMGGNRQNLEMNK